MRSAEHSEQLRVRLSTAAGPSLKDTGRLARTGGMLGSGFARSVRAPHELRLPKGDLMAGERTGGNTGGMGVGGILVVDGIVVMIVWSLVIGLIITLIGLVAFGGFVRGKWYWP